MADSSQPPPASAARNHASTMSHVEGRSANSRGQGYSDANPIPTVQRYVAERARNHKDDSANDLSSGELEKHKEDQVAREEAEAGEDKDEVMKRMKPAQGKPTDQVKNKQGERTVKDPVTGLPVTIKDAELEDYPGAEHLNSLNPAPAVSAVHHTRIGPSPAHPTNISLQPFPPATPPSLGPILLSLHRLALFSVASTAIIWVLVAFRSGWFGFFFMSSILGAVGFGGATLAWGAARKLEKEVEAVRLQMHKDRGEKFSPPMPESVEWLNALVGTVWGLVNPDLFLPMADMVEDIMQQSLPSMVAAVRISDLGQGVNPFRILSMRGLPDHPTDKKYPREEWIDQGKPPPADAGAPGTGPAPDLDQSGDYVNLEVAFAYAAQPGQSNELRSKNIHLLIEFFLGAFDWLEIPIPLWVQIESLVGTVRLRLQFIPEAPFVRNVTFTFMGVPAVEVSVVPMIKALPNILDLPLISTFVKMAIAAGTAEFVAPKSMTLNLQEMLSGAAIGDTRAVGVFIITIHYGEDLSAQDSNGSSDPYIVLAYAKFGKPLYSTRIIMGDLNPVFEETCALLLTADEVKSEESLSLMLWDSDKRTSDDLIGRVKVPVVELMAEPNVMHTRTDSLMGFEDANAMQGKLHWSIGFYEKAPLVKELELPEEHPTTTPSKTMPEMEMRPGDKAPNPAARDGPPPPPDASRTRPDPKWKSGVLSVIVHQINNLEKRDLKGTTAKDREGQAGQDTDQANEQASNLPSSYFELIINDDVCFKSRVSQYSSMPFFEAGTEKFVRDWEKTVVRIVVRDSALREKDPILGIVNIPLAHLFREASEVTRMFAIEEGIGFGRVNVSLLFKPVKTELPPNLLGWETGTVEILAPIKIEVDAAHIELIEDMKKLTISTTDSTEVLPTKEATIEGGQATWEVDSMRLPVYSRFQSVLTLEIQGKSIMGLVGTETKALAVLWLQELIDDEERDIRIPLLIGKDLKQLRQNYLCDFTKKTHDYEIVGWLTTRIKLDSGLDEDHEIHSATQARRHAFETFDHIEGEALTAEKNSHAMDDGVIDKKEAKAIKVADARQQENRQRGVAGFKPYRTAKWMKEGLKARLTPSKSSNKREPMVQSEA
ncbi:hypothetical protein BDY24DRAFT_402483 [Mrakia frigida]|uniref:uncharacterized protein n=1 Tax=Mrakia frigida TaxID=29902 RepID=UPI003FCC06B4